MEITDIRVRKIESSGKMKAIVSITIDGEFVVHDIKIIEGPTRLFIAMPSRQNREGKHIDIAHPIKPETRTKLENVIFEAYEKALKEEPTAEEEEKE